MVLMAEEMVEGSTFPRASMSPWIRPCCGLDSYTWVLGDIP